jgi:hypothetical protein
MVAGDMVEKLDRAYDKDNLKGGCSKKLGMSLFSAESLYRRIEHLVLKI